MGHHCTYDFRFTIENNDLVLYTTAKWKNYSLDIYREYLKANKAECRNLWFTYLAGYTVTFPEEKCRYTHEKYGLEKWGEINPTLRLRWGTYYQDWERVKKLIVEVCPDLKYFVKKYNNDVGYAYLFDVIRNYWKHPESETLYQLGLVDLANNQSLYKLSKPKLKEVIKIISDNKEIVNHKLRLRDIQTYLKTYQDKMTFKDFWQWYVIANDRLSKWGTAIEFEDWKYLQKQANKSLGKVNISKYEYNDYLEMCKKVGHDITEPYWRYPNNFRKNHDLVMEQVRAVNAAKLTLQQDFLKKVCKSMLKYNAEIKGYKIFIPVEAIEWQKTCDVLYQCLVRNGYMKKVINQETIIVFIWKDDEPIATCEIDYKKNIQQFYGDERGHSRGESCLPSEEVQEIFKEWLKTFKPKKEKFKIDQEMHYYKGFTSRDGQSVHTDVGAMDGLHKGSTFVIGNIYETPFEDDEILEAGGRGCVATNKVFHFCNSITEISRHYCPNVYCEVKPLGAVVEHDGALLSNKIEIVRYIPEDEVKKIIALEAQLLQSRITI